MLWELDGLCHRHIASLADVDDVRRLGWSAALWLTGDRDLALAGRAQFEGAVDVAVGVAADHDRLDLTRLQARHVLADDRLAEDRPVQDDPA
jgi:hypothetical protein